MSRGPGPDERMLPPESVAGAPFWAASRDRRLVLPWCVPCDAPHWYPRGFCPTCLGDEIEWRPSSGTGHVYAVSVQPKAPLPTVGGTPPYAVALVDLDDGVRMLLRVEADPDADADADADAEVAAAAVAIGDPVTVGWTPLSDGRHLPVARPA